MIASNIKKGSFGNSIFPTANVQNGQRMVIKVRPNLLVFSLLLLTSLKTMGSIYTSCTYSNHSHQHTWDPNVAGCTQSKRYLFLILKMLFGQVMFPSVLQLFITLGVTAPHLYHHLSNSISVTILEESLHCRCCIMILLTYLLQITLSFTLFP